MEKARPFRAAPVFNSYAERSAIAVEVIVTIIEATAAIAPAFRNSEHTIHGADGATDTSAHGAADQATDWTGNPAALIGAFLRAAHDTLRMTHVGDRQQSQRQSGSGEMTPSGRSFRECRCLDLGVHFRSSTSYAG
jgi:hypothetical protein